MKVLHSATAAPGAKNVMSGRIALLYAAILTVMTTAQLFSFDDFLELIGTFGGISGAGGAYFVAAFLVTSEVLALPFLLRMSLSPAFRWMSMAFGLIAAAIWVKVTIGLALQTMGVENAGLLGTVIDVVPGWGSVLIGILLATLAAWSAWGLWPWYDKSINKERTWN